MTHIKTFRQFLEMAFYPPDTRKNEHIEYLNTIKTTAKSIGDVPILWRGMKAKHAGAVVKADNKDRVATYGMINDNIKQTVKDLVGEIPFFTTPSAYSAKFFAQKFNGNVYAVVPTTDFTLFWNPNVKDLAHVKDQINIKDYQSSNTIPTDLPDVEVLLKTDHAYFITLGNIMNELRIKELPKTYSDLAVMLDKYDTKLGLANR